jgi:GNAT superfamily N-acetyltransferase
MSGAALSSMASPTTTVTLRLIDADDPADADLYRRANDAVRIPAEQLLLGDRAAPLTADELLAMVRGEKSWANHVGVTLDAGEPVGVWGYFLPLLDNLEVAYCDDVVRPDRRREGIGTLQLAEIEREVRAAGRRVVQCFEGHPIDPDAEDPTRDFALRHGFRSTLPALRSDLDLDGTPEALDAALAVLDAEVTGADLADYRLVTWWDRCPDEHLEDRALLRQRMSTDAPQGDMVLEEEVWDGARVRESEQVAADRGATVVETCALHVPSGRLAAFTVLEMPADRRQAFQEDTLVLREHRGHRLGMWVKAANLRAMASRFEVRRVVTYNAVENAPMLRVNRAMGFRPVLRTSCWTKHLDGGENT